MTRTRTPYEPDKAVLDPTSATDYVKRVLDCKAPPYKGGYEMEGRSILPARYSNLKDDNQKKLIAGAIVQLLYDPDYSCDAIPVAAELGLPEAREWFLGLSEKPMEEMRNITTNSYTNGLICFVLYASKSQELIRILENIILNNGLSTHELFVASFNVSENDPDFVLNNLGQILARLLPAREKESDKLTDISFTTSGIFKKYGDGYCIELAKRFKENLPKEHQILFYKALAQNPTPRFKPYLEELKIILEIPD